MSIRSYILRRRFQDNITLGRGCTVLSHEKTNRTIEPIPHHGTSYYEITSLTSVQRFFSKFFKFR
jgi:hypothetical protein